MFPSIQLLNVRHNYNALYNYFIAVVFLIFISEMCLYYYNYDIVIVCITSDVKELNVV